MTRKEGYSDQNNECGPMVSVDQLFETQAARNPDRIAITFGKESWTFEELQTRSNTIADRISSTSDPEPVGIFMRPSPLFIAALLGSLKSGVPYVPLDPSWPKKRLEFISRDCRIRSILTTSDQSAAFESFTLFGEIISVDRLEPSKFARKMVRLPRSDDTLAYITYTSGSTGQPKGVMVTRRNLANYTAFACAKYFCDVTSTTPLIANVATDLAVTSIFPSLASGKPIQIFEDESPIISLADALRRGERFGVIKLTPSHLRLLEALLEGTGALNAQCLVVGGEQLERKRLAFWLAATQARVINEYGPTETTVGCTAHEVDRTAKIDRPIVSIGRPLPGYSVHVLDQAMQPVAPGVVGELYVGGVGVARGYINRPDLTAERFLPDTFGTDCGARLYKTGDLGYCAEDGDLSFVGRADRQLKVRGYRVEPEEIELALCQFPGVTGAVVLTEKSRQSERLVALLSTRPGRLVDADLLRAFLADQLPTHMIPVRFEQLETLPLAASGKTDVSSLSETLVNNEEGRKLQMQLAAERDVRTVWSDVLDIHDPGLDVPFFSLGGDSILAIQVVIRLRSLGYSATPKELFELQTIRELAVRLTQSGDSSAALIDLPETPSLTPIQSWFFEQRFIDWRYWNNAFMIALPRGVRSEVIEDVIQQIISNHEVFGWRFKYDGERVDIERDAPRLGGVTAEYQIDPASSSIDLSDIVANQHTQIDPASGCLINVAIVRRPSEPDLLSVVAHHIAVDLVSWQVLRGEFDSLLQAPGARRPLPKEMPFSICAAALASLASECVSEVDYWLNTSGAFDRLPSSKIEESSLEESSEFVFVSMQRDDTERLRNACSARHATMADASLGLLLLAFRDHFDITKIRVDLESPGRSELSGLATIDGTVGWFTALYPAVFDLGGATDLLQVINRANQITARAPRNGISYGVLRYLSPDPSVRSRMSKIQPSQIRVNHLGNAFLGTEGLDSLVRDCSRGRGNHRPYRLEVDSWIASGSLMFRVSFSRREYDTESIRRFVERLKERARAFLAEHEPTEARHEAAISRSSGLEDEYALSPLQKGILFDADREPSSPAYFAQLSAVLQGDIDPILLREAWQLVVDQEPVLRTSFTTQESGDAVQIVHKLARLPFVSGDWTDRSKASQDRDMEQYLIDDRRQPFDLSSAPLLRVHLIRLSERRFWIVWSHHHIILDGWSLAPLLAKVLSNYSNLTGRAGHQVKTSGSYVDYIRWLERVDVRGAQAFWQNRLAALEEPLPLAMHRTVVGTPTLNSDLYLQTGSQLEKAKFEDLRSFAQSNGLTLNTIFQAAWALVLSRLTRNDDTVFGTVVSGRPFDLPGVEHMLGLFINTIPVRINVWTDVNVAEWLHNVQEAQREADNFQYCSLADLHQWAGLPPMARLFESVIVFENYPAPESAWQQQSAFAVSEIQTFERTNYPLTLSIHQTEGIHLTLTHSRDRFDRESAIQILQDLIAAVNILAADANRKVRDIQLPCPVGPSVESSRMESLDLAAAFVCRVKSEPDAIAVRSDTCIMTYGDLAQRVKALARFLAFHGLRRGDSVLMLDCESLAGVVAILATVMCSAAFIVLRRDAPESQIVQVGDECKPTIIIVSSAGDCASLLETASQTELSGLTILKWSEIEQAMQAEGNLKAFDWDEQFTFEKTENLPLYINYTSGTTASPKGMLHRRQGVSAFIRWFGDEFGIVPESCVAQWAPLSYDAAYVEIFSALSCGATLCLLSPEDKYTASRLECAIERHRITHLQTTPSMMAQVISAEARSDSLGHRLETIDHVLLAGEMLSTSLARRLRNAIGLKATIVNLYGPSETILATYHRLGEIDDNDRVVPIGYAIPRRRISIVDHHLRPVPAGVTGEIEIESPDVTEGYLNGNNASERAFVPGVHGGWPRYRTGDLGRHLGSGLFEFVGRSDNQIKLRGMRLELESVEATLSRHRQVAECLVAVDNRGSGDVRLTAYVVSALSGDNLSYAEMRRYLRRSLPDAFVPTALQVVRSLPRTWNGKLDRAFRLEEPTENESAIVHELTVVESSLRIIWSVLLKVDITNPDASFLDFGGHSLLAAQLLARVERIFGVKISMEQFFEAPTIRFMCRTIELSEQGSRQAEAFLRNWELALAAENKVRDRSKSAIDP